MSTHHQWKLTGRRGLNDDPPSRPIISGFSLVRPSFPKKKRKKKKPGQSNRRRLSHAKLQGQGELKLS
jgi:hypothetical protein